MLSEDTNELALIEQCLHSFSDKADIQMTI